MSDDTSIAAHHAARKARTKKRYAAERRFRFYGVLAILSALGFLAFLFTSIIGNGWSAFLQTSIRLDIHFDEQVIDPSGTRADMQLRTANYQRLAREALATRLGIDTGDRALARDMNALLSRGVVVQLRDMVLED